MRCRLDSLQWKLDSIGARFASRQSFSGLKAYWWLKLLVISERNRQESIQLNVKTRSITDRSLNLVQRSVRPVVRGKARAVVEFGGKISIPCGTGFASLYLTGWDPCNMVEGLVFSVRKSRQE
jgi:IS5 family transposase